MSAPRLPIVEAVCCRTWPVTPLAPIGRCGLCGVRPVVVKETHA